MNALQPSDMKTAKFNMIQQQIRPWEVLDPRVLDCLAALDREAFLPEKLAGIAYADYPLPAGHGELLLPPVLEGRMLQALDLKDSDSVLEIGSGTGYLTACLACLAARVVSLDAYPDITTAARERLQQLSVDNARFETIESLNDIRDKERYDAIAVGAGSLPAVPQNLLEALAIGGRLFAIVGHSPVMSAELITRLDSDDWQTEKLFETDIPPLSFAG